MSVSGIYKFENVINGKLYVGSAVDLDRRRIQHFRALKRGDHENSHLQRAYRKYGSESFTFSVLERVEDPNDLIEREQHYIDSLGFDELYNLAPKAGSRLGIKASEETRQRMSKALKGKKVSDDHRRKLSVAHKGKIISKETRRKMSAAKKGEKHNLYGKSHSDETRQRMSEAKIGKTLSDDHRHKIGEANTGEKHYLYGKSHSAETRRKIGEAQNKPVNKIHLQTGEVLQIYQSVTKAALDVGVNKSSISKVLRGRKKSAGGYFWAYAE